MGAPLRAALSKSLLYPHKIMISLSVIVAAQLGRKRQMAKANELIESDLSHAGKPALINLSPNLFILILEWLGTHLNVRLLLSLLVPSLGIPVPPRKEVRQPVEH